MTGTFDSLGYARRLENAGFTRAQAEAQAEALRDVIEGQLATKRDLQEMEYRLTIKLGGIAIACAGLVIAILPMLINK